MPKPGSYDQHNAFYEIQQTNKERKKEKMKRLEVSFGGGSSSVVYSVRDGRFFDYEKDGAELHSRYGGKQYYTSCSGMSGAGYLDDQGDLIAFGHYRTDCRGHQAKAVVHRTKSGQEIFGYAPTISHGGIDSSMPFVLTDGYKVAFVSPAYRVGSSLLGWDEIEGKPLTQTYFTQEGQECKLDFQLHNPEHFRGCRATRFVDLREARKTTEAIHYNSSPTVFERKLNIVQIGSLWFHLNTDQLLDIKWESNPRDIEGDILFGWRHEGNGLYWRRRGNEVQVFAEVRRDGFAGGKYAVAGQTAEFIDFEEDFSVLEWFSKTTEDWKKYFMAKLTAKARQEFVYARQQLAGQMDIRAQMEANPEARICVQDSLDCGNCRPGTEDFVRRYGVELDPCGCTSVAELLKNKGIDEMLKNFSFARVVSAKLVGLAVDKELGEIVAA